MSSTRRTALRTAAALTGAAAVLALPVGSAFADSPRVPPVTPPVEGGGQPVEMPVAPKSTVVATETQVRVVPGGVKAGAAAVDAAPKSHTPVLLAAGGGMAAVGAAGLGFAMRGRGRG
ncbi:hypothetical protein [Streptomyces sp. NBC_01276]|uniref:hypothetical protein n=1 Tax=Streptomyces sp. NBC_01276 TaxID=2903808 RepID=UPI00352CA2C2